MFVPRIKWKLALLLLASAFYAFVGAESLKQIDDLDRVQNPTLKVGEGDLRISDINVLLPVQNCKDDPSAGNRGECRSAFKIIKAYNGCYQWKISHPSVVKMEALSSKTHPDCANVVEVSSLSNRETKTVVKLTAQEQHSKHVLTSQVKVAKIDKIEIFSRFSQINKGNKQHLQVLAYDDQGNTFSTLDGFRFDWDIISGGEDIRRIKVKDSHMSTHGHSHIEDSNWVQSDDFVLSALETGHTELRVKILEPGYEHIAAAHIKLTIVDPFVIQPAFGVDEEDEVIKFDNEADRFNTFNDNGILRILPNSYFDFQLSLVKEADDKSFYYENIQASRASTHYNWTVPKSEQKFGNIQSSGRFLSKEKPGQAEIVVIDRQFPNNTDSVDVHVVEPYSLKHVITDVTEAYKKSLDPKGNLQRQLGVKRWDGNWILVEEHYYLIKVYLLDKENNAIKLTPNLLFDHKVEEARFEVIANNSIKSEVLIRAKSLEADRYAKKTVVRSSLKAIGSQLKAKYTFDQEKLKEESDATITSPVQPLHPTDLILLPLQSEQSWELKGKGGSGSYIWTAEDAGIVETTQTALVKPIAIGQTRLRVSDSLNAANFAFINAEVQRVNTLTWLEQTVEGLTDVHETRLLHAIAIDSKGRKFTNCSALPLQYSIQDSAFVKTADFRSPSWKELNSELGTRGSLFNLTMKKQLFEEEPGVVYWGSLKTQDISKFVASTDKIEKLTYNNFGVCDVISLRASQEGKSTVTAFFNAIAGNAVYSSTKVRVHGEAATALAYTKIRPNGPHHDIALADLWASNLTEFETHRIKKLYPTEELKQYFLPFGSSFNWELTGGTVNLIQQEDSDMALSHFEFDTRFNVKIMSKSTKEDLLQISALTSNVKKLRLSPDTSTLLSVKCMNPKDGKVMDSTFSYTLEVTQQVKVSKHLLTPKTHSEKVQITCSAPASSSTFWAQERISSSQQQGFLPVLPQGKFSKDVFTYFVLTNSKHLVKNVLTGGEGQAAIDGSSVLTEFLLSNTSLAKLEDFEGSKLSDMDLALSKQKRWLQFGAQTGHLTLEARSFGYKKEALRDFTSAAVNPAKTLTAAATSEIRSSLAIEIVENLRVEPSFKSIYFQGGKNNYTFEVIHGSGEFAVEIISQPGKEKPAKVVQRGRFITLVPTRPGSVTIEIKDLKLINSEPAYAELRTSEVAKLDLQTDAYFIELSQHVNMTATAFDSQLQPFEADQYQYMDLKLRTSDIIKQGGLRYQIKKDVEGNLRIFEVRGSTIGNFQVNAFVDSLAVDQHGYTVGLMSDSVQIEVFPAFRINPQNLLLTPNMQYTLKIEGGPQSIFQSKQKSGGSTALADKPSSGISPVSCSISDESKASIDQEMGSEYREVTGHHIGNATLVCQVVHRRPSEVEGETHVNQVVSQTSLTIRIRLVTSIDITNYGQSLVFSGSVIKHLAVLKFNDELFSFGLAPLSFSWSTSDSSTLKPDPPLSSASTDESATSTHVHARQKTIRDNLKRDDRAVFITSFNSSSIYSKAQKQGEVRMNVKMAIEYPSEYSSKQNQFSTSALVKIQDRLSVAIPEYLANSERSTHQYLLPPNTQSKIETNRKSKLHLHYSQESVPLLGDSNASSDASMSTEPMIELGKEDTSVRTLDRYGQVTLLMKEEQSYGNQVVMLNLLITDIFALVAENFHESVSLPTGTSLTLPLKFLNEHGHLFAKNIEGVFVGLELSHPKVIGVELDKFNQSLTLTPKHLGECNVLIYLEKNPEIFDVIKIRVANIVEPSSSVQLHVGSDIFFKIDKTQLDQKQLDSTNEIIWRSSNPSTLDINSKTGQARALTPGHAEVNTQIKDLNAISHLEIRHITEAKIIDQSNLILNVDSQDSELRVYFQLYFKNWDYPVKNILRFPNTDALIDQNIGLACSSDQSSLLETKGEVRNEDQFFCAIRPVSNLKNKKALPNLAKIKVQAISYGPKAANGQREAVTKNEVLEFDVTLAGEITVEAKFSKGVKLGRNKRRESIQILSLTPIKAQVGAHNDKLIAELSKNDADLNLHTLELSVPTNVKQSFKTEVLIKSLIPGVSSTKVQVTYKAGDVAITSSSKNKADASSSASFDTPADKSSSKGSSKAQKPAEAHGSSSPTKKPERETLEENASSGGFVSFVFGLLMNRYVMLGILFMIAMNQSSILASFSSMMGCDLDNTRSTFLMATNNSFRHGNYKKGDSKHYGNENPFLQGEGPTHRMRESVVAAGNSWQRDASYFDRSQNSSGFM